MPNPNDQNKLTRMIVQGYKYLTDPSFILGLASGGVVGLGGYGLMSLFDKSKKILPSHGIPETVVINVPKEKDEENLTKYGADETFADILKYSAGFLPGIYAAWKLSGKIHQMRQDDEFNEKLNEVNAQQKKLLNLKRNRLKSDEEQGEIYKYSELYKNAGPIDKVKELLDSLGELASWGKATMAGLYGAAIPLGLIGGYKLSERMNPESIKLTQYSMGAPDVIFQQEDDEEDGKMKYSSLRSNDLLSLAMVNGIYGMEKNAKLPPWLSSWSSAKEGAKKLLSWFFKPGKVKLDKEVSRLNTLLNKQKLIGDKGYQDILDYAIKNPYDKTAQEYLNKYIAAFGPNAAVPKGDKVYEALNDALAKIISKDKLLNAKGVVGRTILGSTLVGVPSYYLWNPISNLYGSVKGLFGGAPAPDSKDVPPPKKDSGLGEWMEELGTTFKNRYNTWKEKPWEDELTYLAPAAALPLLYLGYKTIMPSPKIYQSTDPEITRKSKKEKKSSLQKRSEKGYYIVDQYGNKIWMGNNPKVDVQDAVSSGIGINPKSNKRSFNTNGIQNYLTNEKKMLDKANLFTREHFNNPPISKDEFLASQQGLINNLTTSNPWGYNNSGYTKTNTIKPKSNFVFEQPKYQSSKTKAESFFDTIDDTDGVTKALNELGNKTQSVNARTNATGDRRKRLMDTPLQAARGIRKSSAFETEEETEEELAKKRLLEQAGLLIGKPDGLNKVTPKDIKIVDSKKKVDKIGTKEYNSDVQKILTNYEKNYVDNAKTNIETPVLSRAEIRLNKAEARRRSKLPVSDPALLPKYTTKPIKKQWRWTELEDKLRNLGYHEYSTPIPREKRIPTYLGREWEPEPKRDFFTGELINETKKVTPDLESKEKQIISNLENKNVQ